MDIRNRTNDIVALRCHVCQDFLRLVLIPDWKQKLYQKAQHAVETNFYKENYIEAYHKMRELGLEAYDVDCMDVSFIAVIIRFCSEIAPTQKNTKDAIRKLAEDRNTTNHSSENEPSEELYLRGLLSVTDIISFIKTVDISETTIADSERLQFRAKWFEEADRLKKLLDAERIEYVQISNEVEQDIRVIKESANALTTWCDVFDKYRRHYQNTARYRQFVVAASDEGISYSHTHAAALFLQKRDFNEFFQRLQLCCKNGDHLSKSDVHSILEEINAYLYLGYRETEQLTSIVSHLSEIGFDIYKNEGGYYKLQKK